MTSTISIPFAIIGGGIGGLAAALGVARSGREVTVLEQAPEFSEVGAGLQLGPNALAVLDQLGVLEKVKEKAFFPVIASSSTSLRGKNAFSLTFSNTPN